MLLFLFSFYIHASDVSPLSLRRDKPKLSLLRVGDERSVTPGFAKEDGAFRVRPASRNRRMHQARMNDEARILFSPRPGDINEPNEEDSLSGSEGDIAGDHPLVDALPVVDSSRRTEFTFRVATMGDLPELLKMFAQMNDQDRHNLVTYPGKFMRLMLEKAIRRKSLHIALCGERIVSMAKAFIIKSWERKQILNTELLCTGEKAHLLEAGIYTSICSDVIAKTTGKDRWDLAYKHLSSGARKRNEIALKTQQTYDRKRFSIVYYGWAYTVENFRGRRIGSILKDKAFNYLVKELSADAVKGSSYIALVYGQVEANEGNTAEVRMFMRMVLDFLMVIYDKSLLRRAIDGSRNPLRLDIFSAKFRACKPIFFQGYDGDLYTELPPCTDREWRSYERLNGRACSRLIWVNIEKLQRRINNER